MCYAVEEIEREIGTSGERGVSVLFYNQQAKEVFEQKIKERISKIFVGTIELSVLWNGTILLYTYSVGKPTHYPITTS